MKPILIVLKEKKLCKDLLKGLNLRFIIVNHQDCLDIFCKGKEGNYDDETRDDEAAILEYYHILIDSMKDNNMLIIEEVGEDESNYLQDDLFAFTADTIDAICKEKQGELTNVEVFEKLYS